MPSKTIAELETELEKARKSGKRMTQARTALRIVVLHDAVGGAKVERLRLLKEALGALQEIKSPSKKDAKMFAAILAQCEANAAIATNDGAKAEEELRNAIAEWRRVPDLPAMAGALEQLGHLFLRMQRWEDAREPLESAASLFANQDDSWARGRIAYLRGVLARKVDDRAAAIRFFEEAIPSLRDAGAHGSLGHALVSLADERLLRVEMDDAVTALQDALEAFAQAGDMAGESQVRARLGVIETAAGGDGAETLAAAAKAAEAAGDPAAVYQSAIATGFAALEAGRTDEAEAHARRAIDIAAQLATVPSDAFAILATVAIRAGSVDDAKRRIAEAREQLRARNDTRGEAVFMASIATAYSDHGGNPAAALQITELAIEATNQDPRLLGLMFWQRSDLLKALGRDAEAVAQLREAITTLDRAKLATHASIARIFLAVHLRDAGDLDGALTALEGGSYTTDLLQTLPAWALLVRADILLSKEGGSKEALARLGEAAGLFAEGGDGVGLANCWEMIADVLELSGLQEKAADSRQRAEKLAADDPGITLGSRSFLDRIRGLRKSLLA